MKKLSVLKIVLGIPILMLSAFAEAATVSQDAKPPIPSDLFFEYPYVADDDNAIINWRRAAQILIPLEEKEKEVLAYCWTPEAKTPSNEDRNRLEVWLRRNKDALELFEASLKKPKAQWPERNAQNVQKELIGFPQLIRARLLEADLLAEKGQFDQTRESLLQSLRLVQFGLEGDGALLHYLVSGSTRTLVQNAILRLAAHRALPVPILEDLLKKLPSINTETNLYAKTLRVEFLTAYAGLNLKKLAEDWSKVPEDGLAMMYYPEEFRRPFKVFLDPSLILQHPKPVAVRAEIERSIRNFRIYRTNSFSRWADRNTTVEKENAKIQAKLERDVKPLMKLVEDEALPLTKQAADRAREAYLKIENPIGRIFRCSTDLLSGDASKVFRYRTGREAIRTTLAILIFERRKEQLPVSLSDLVEEKILDSLPNDPFANAPFFYSRPNRIVWSVGENGVNDGGDKDQEYHWLGDDAVWQIPQIK